MQRMSKAEALVGVEVKGGWMDGEGRKGRKSHWIHTRLPGLTSIRAAGPLCTRLLGLFLPVVQHSMGLTDPDAVFEVRVPAPPGPARKRQRLVEHLSFHLGLTNRQPRTP